MSAPLPPAGVSPAGFFVPNKFPEKEELFGFLADPIDMTTGEYLSIEEGFDPDDAWVITALRTVRGSGSAVTNVGRDFSEVTHVSPLHANILRQEILLALQPIVEAQVIVVQEVTVEEFEDSYKATVVYRHTSDGSRRELVVPLNSLIRRAS